MAVTHGMDVGEVRRLGGSLQSKADQLDRLIKDVDRSVGGSSWVGPDAVMFKAQWWPEHKAQLLRASQDLHGLGQSALNNADEQDKASSADATGTAGSGGVSVLRLDELRATASGLESPAEVNAWWSSLSQAERDALLAEDPAFVGNTDGIPPEVRYAANRASIEGYLLELRAARSATDSSLLAGALDARIEQFEGFLSDGPAGEPRQFLLFDVAGDGRIAEVFGDLATADDIAVVVPGVGTDLENYSPDNALSLYDADARTGDMATVMWLGYDTPPGFEIDSLTDWSSVSTGRAEEHAQSLVGFTDGLKATGLGEVTIVAHSYGTVLATEAAKLGMSVDRVVLLGSPGVPAGDASVFNGADVFAGTSPRDGIAAAGNIVHGTDPTDASFGAKRLAVPGASHSTYLDPGSPSLESVVRAIESSHVRSDGMVVTRTVDDDGNATDLILPTY